MADGQLRDRPLVARLLRIRHLTWRLLVKTVAICMRYRVTGLAGEAAFFAVLSIPPLIFALAGSVGFVTERYSPTELLEFREATLTLASKALTINVVDSVIVPTVDQVLFAGPRYDVISVGFFLALWSGSRALNVFVDTITIMHGLGGRRGIVATRALSFFLYALGMITGAISIPLVLAGPNLIASWLPDRLDFLIRFYWPAVVVLCVCFLAALYHVSVPVRTRWIFNLPGATLSLLVWIYGSALLRWVLTTTAGESSSIFGPLAAPIIVLIWLYLVSIAVLIGAALNAAVDVIFDPKTIGWLQMDPIGRLRATVGRKEPEPPED